MIDGRGPRVVENIRFFNSFLAAAGCCCCFRSALSCRSAKFYQGRAANRAGILRADLCAHTYVHARRELIPYALGGPSVPGNLSRLTSFRSSAISRDFTRSTYASDSFTADRPAAIDTNKQTRCR